MNQRARWLKRLSWLVAAAGVAPGALVWYAGPHGGFAHLTGYHLFPLFGLVAFGLMWSHYIVAALRLMLGLNKSITKQFREITGLVVLAAILLHPYILIYSLKRDGFGWPPGSYLDHYVSPGLKWAALIGTFSFFIFIFYEAYRWLEDRRWWWIVQAGSDAAILAIMLHGFRLGGDLQSGWFQWVWLFYAETLAAALVFMYHRKLRSRKNMVG